MGFILSSSSFDIESKNMFSLCAPVVLDLNTLRDPCQQSITSHKGGRLVRFVGYFRDRIHSNKLLFTLNEPFECRKGIIRIVTA